MNLFGALFPPQTYTTSSISLHKKLEASNKDTLGSEKDMKRSLERRGDLGVMGLRATYTYRSHASLMNAFCFCSRVAADFVNKLLYNSYKINEMIRIESSVCKNRPKHYA